MNKKKTKSVYFILLLVVLTIFTLFPIPVNAIADNEEKAEITGYLGETPKTRLTESEVVYHVMNKKFYIKNAFSGQYLDVSNGTAESFTNVHQYPYNGTAAQRWYINYNGDGTFTLYSDVGNNMVLDIDNANPNNGANAHIYEYKPANKSQYFNEKNFKKFTIYF